MPRLFSLVLAVLSLASCSQNTGGAFSPVSPSPVSPVQPAQLDQSALRAIHSAALGATLSHTTTGNLDLTWGAGAPMRQVDGPYTNAVPEADALALQAIRAAHAGPETAVAAATVDAFKQLDGPRGGAYLLLADAAHPPPSGPPAPADPAPAACPTPAATAARPECLRRQVSDGLLAAWYAPDTRMFFKVGETSTIYRPVDAIAVGCALVVAGFQERNEQKIQAGNQIVQREMRTDLDDHFGLLAGLVTATAQGGREVTDHVGRLADQAGAAEALLEAFDFSREQPYMSYAQRLLQPLLAEQVPLRAPSGGYITAFDLQTSGPGDHLVSDVVATLLVLQAARHYDRDDGGRFARLEETAAAALAAVLSTDRGRAGDTGGGLPAIVPEAGVGVRSGLATALAAVVLADVSRDLGGAASPSPGSG
ncbi:MAG: hypothetical protein ABR598_02755 [Candidatus Dormibacteria bacterium]